MPRTARLRPSCEPVGPARPPAGLAECFSQQMFGLSGMVAGLLEGKVTGPALLESDSLTSIWNPSRILNKNPSVEPSPKQQS